LPWWRGALLAAGVLLTAYTAVSLTPELLDAITNDRAERGYAEGAFLWGVPLVPSPPAPRVPQRRPSPWERPQVPALRSSRQRSVSAPGLAWRSAPSRAGGGRRDVPLPARRHIVRPWRIA